jgi:hypothetical protein
MQSRDVATDLNSLVRAHWCTAAKAAARRLIPVARSEVRAGPHLLVAVLLATAAAAAAGARRAERGAPRLARGRVEGRGLQREMSRKIETNWSVPARR